MTGLRTYAEQLAEQAEREHALLQPYRDAKDAAVDLLASRDNTPCSYEEFHPEYQTGKWRLQTPEWYEARNDQIRDARDAGCTYPQIADIWGLTVGRLRQIYYVDRRGYVRRLTGPCLFCGAAEGFRHRNVFSAEFGVSVAVDDLGFGYDRVSSFLAERGLA